MNRISSARLATSLFATDFSGRPHALASAPGRVNLIGEHTDYNGGPVLPVALERRTAVAASHADDWLVTSTMDRKVRAIGVGAPLRKAWTDYLVGVARELRAVGAAPAGAHVAVASNLPIGAGLSSSAALTVAAAKALSLLAGRRLTPAQLVDVAYRAEHDQVGVRCGRMDQTIAAHGERGTALLFETATGALQRVPFGGRLWIVETGVSHKLVGGELNQRRRECETALALCREWRPEVGHLAELVPGDLDAVARRLPPELVPRVRHVVTETARTREAAAALAQGDLPRLGRLLVEGHESLRADYQSTVPEADFIVASAVERGAYGARLTGAGWGGAVVVLAPAEREARILAEVGRDFHDKFGRAAEVWSTRASSGVRRESVPV
ncbi:MAG: galactokinase [Gemmatimonadales bacterium]|nr:galactokinase [Gemmatimonadales bacterium]